MPQTQNIFINKNESKGASLRSLLGQPPEHRCFSAGMVHNFYIYNEITEADNYVDLITVLDTANENDQVNLYLNTPGGSLSATLSIIHAINRSQATVTAIADGDVHSAGTLIFLAAPNRSIMPYANFMFHDASSGVNGKVSEITKNLEASKKLLTQINSDIYYPYLSEEEIDDVLSGRDLWLDANEMYQRILEVQNAEDEEDE